MLPLLDSINCLMQFAQKRDVYVCDFVAALKICDMQIFSMYLDHQTAFKSDEFWAHQGLAELTHESIFLKWWPDMNTSSEHLAFMVNGDKHFAKHLLKPVDKEMYTSLVLRVQAECAGTLVLPLPFCTIAKMLCLVNSACSF